MLRGRTIGAALAAAALAAGILGCGDGTEPSIPRSDAETLISTLAEIQANVDEGSCFVAADRTDELLAEVNELPSDVDQDVRNALAEGANNLKQLLLSDPEECERVDTTTEETTTEETTTEETQTQETQTQEQTQTQETQTQEQTQTQTQPPSGGGGSGGVGPGGIGGGP